MSEFSAVMRVNGLRFPDYGKMLVDGADRLWKYEQENEKLLARVEQLEADGKRLAWLVLDDLQFDTIGNIDLHEAAYANAVKDNRQETRRDDYIEAMRGAIDAVMAGDTK